MRVRMADERAVHIEQCDPAEIAVHDTQSRRHLSLQSSVGLPGNEPPLDFIEKDREDQAENRDVQQANIHGVDRRNLPLNHKADAVMGATISEDRNQEEARPGPRALLLLAKHFGRHTINHRPVLSSQLPWASSMASSQPRWSAVFVFKTFCLRRQCRRF
jgi:hypothetical protein